MRLIDADALIDSMGLANAVKWGNKDRYQQDNSYRTLMRYEIKDDIDAQPTIDAVPLDRLCKWLADELHASADCGIDHCDNCDAYDGTLSVKGCWMKLIKEQVMEEDNADKD